MTRNKFIKYGIYCCLVVGVALSLGLNSCNILGFKNRPNIILITVDTLRPDHLGCYGYPANTSPSIDLFAQDAVLYENCFSHAPNTWASCSSILSGFLPHEAKILLDVPLLPMIKTLPEILPRKEYRTMAVVSNYVLRKGKGYEQGFEIYDDTLSDFELVRHLPERIAEHTTDKAIELIRRFHKKRFFIWIHYQDPHGPYTPPGKYAGMFPDYKTKKPLNLKFNASVSGYGGIPTYQRLGSHRNFNYYVSQYDGEIRYLDENFKRLINSIKNLEIYDDSLIILSADHGEGMGEQHYYFAHGENLRSSLIRVPLIIKYDKHSSGRRRDFVQHIDIVPTILNILDIESDPRLRGFDLRKRQKKGREIFSAMISRTARNEFDSSIIIDGLKLIYIASPYKPIGQKSLQLYDLRTDPHEKHNLIHNALYQSRAGKLKERLKTIRKEDSLGLKDIVVKPPKLSKEEKEKLRSLGYVQ